MKKSQQFPEQRGGVFSQGGGRALLPLFKKLYIGVLVLIGCSVEPPLPAAASGYAERIKVHEL